MKIDSLNSSILAPTALHTPRPKTHSKFPLQPNRLFDDHFLTRHQGTPQSHLGGTTRIRHLEQLVFFLISKHHLFESWSLTTIFFFILLQPQRLGYLGQ